MHFKFDSAEFEYNHALIPSGVSIQLGPVQPDPMCTAMYDRRRQLEEMRDDASILSTPEPSSATDGDASAGVEANNDDDYKLFTRLKRSMEQAIQCEDYERAAELRDEIKRLEESRD